MRPHVERPSGFILPLSVTFAIPYLAAIVAWFVYLETTVRYAGTAMIPGLHFGVATAFNVGIGVWAAWQLRNSLKRTDSYRGPHLASLLLLLVTLAAIQWGLHALRIPLEFSR